jgi:hypothetical protein
MILTESEAMPLNCRWTEDLDSQVEAVWRLGGVPPQPRGQTTPTGATTPPQFQVNREQQLLPQFQVKTQKYVKFHTSSNVISF